jgi:hypothetical protein
VIDDVPRYIPLKASLGLYFLQSQYLSVGILLNIMVYVYSLRAFVFYALTLHKSVLVSVLVYERKGERERERDRALILKMFLYSSTPYGCELWTH